LHSVATGAMARLLVARAPCVLQMHGVEWQRSRWSRGAKMVLQSLEKISFRDASAFTAVSQRQRDFYQKRYGRPVEFIPTGTALPEAPHPELVTKLGLPPNRYYLTAVRQVREKGLHHLIPAFLRLDTDWHLVIAGAMGGDSTYCRQLREMAAGHPRIHFLAHVTDPLLGSLYALAGAYVQASEIEGMAVSLLDAMSHGNCCIVSNIPENLDVVGPAGLSFLSRNIGDLASKMQLASQDRGQAAALGLAARSRVLSEFTWDAVTDRLESLYHRSAASWMEDGARMGRSSLQHPSHTRGV
jgi:glycosyltransferase involved in cell wall biosynthesis